MKKLAKFFVFTFLFMFAISGTILADDYYICLGSFSKLENASNFQESLAFDSIRTEIESCIVKEKDFYRVVLKEPSQDLESARQRVEKLTGSAVSVRHGLKNMWICKSNPANFIVSGKTAAPAPVSSPASSEMPLPQPEPQILPEPVESAAKSVAVPEILPPQKEILLETNTEETIPVSEEKPYSLLVRSYKEELNAQNDKKRLEEKDIDSYIVKTYDEKEYFSFDLHAGAFATPEETEPLQAQLEELGIEDTEISDFREIADSIEKYDQVVKTEKVSFNTGNADIPESISPAVQELIREFPINTDFEIESIRIYDIENALKCGNFESDSISDITDLVPFFDLNKTHALTATLYRDSLFDKSVAVIIVSGEPGTFTQILDGTPVSFKMKNEIMNCYITSDDGDFVINGFNSDKSLSVTMLSRDFTEDEFKAFVNDFTNDSNLLVYPQIRKSLLVLPDYNPEVERTFLTFTLNRVPESYVAAKNYADWAYPIVGHWCAEGNFKQNDEIVTIGFYDMDYDYNASKVHEMFRESHVEGVGGHSLKIKDCESWFIFNYLSNEISFSTKSYIIAVNNCSYDEESSEKILSQLSNDLKIWNTNPEANAK